MSTLDERLVAFAEACKTKFDALTASSDFTLRSDLAGSSGSALVDTVGNGTGAIARSVQSKLRDIATPMDFGAIGSGTDDDTAALQAFWTDVIANSHPHKADGVYGISSTLTIGPLAAVADPGIPLNGRMKLVALNGMNELVRLKNLTYRRWIGGLFLKGTGSTSYASRTCQIAAYFENCARLGFSSGIRADNFALGGAWLGTANNNMLQLGMVEMNNIGSGQAGGNGLTGAWTSGSQTGSSGSTGQGQTVNLDTFYSSALDTYLDVAGQNDPVHLRINGYPYSVKSIDRVGGTAVIYPWLDPAAGSSGTYEWVFGGGVYLRSTDANLVEINSLDGANCGRLLTVAVPYGPVVNNLQAAGCGTIALLGRNNAAVCTGTLIKGFYAEGSTNQEHLVCNTTIGASDWAQMLADNGNFDLTKCYNISAPRSSSGSGPLVGDEFGATTAAAGSIGVSRKGRMLGFVKNNLNNLPGSSINLRGQAHDPRITTYRKDTVTLLLNVEGSGEYNRLFGYSGGNVLIFGTGTNGAPTSVTFTPPAGGTINGGSADATVTFAGFDGPALFSYEHTDTAQQTWLVRPTTGRTRYGLSGTAVKGDADATLTAFTDKITQRFTTALTANRAVTLSTTGAVEGNRFKIVRPATGAFNLNVGTGPLKALAAGTWCEVEYDGSAWQLTANGSL